MTEISNNRLGLSASGDSDNDRSVITGLSASGDNENDRSVIKDPACLQAGTARMTDQ